MVRKTSLVFLFLEVFGGFGGGLFGFFVFLVFLGPPTVRNSITGFHVGHIIGAFVLTFVLVLNSYGFLSKTTQILMGGGTLANPGRWCLGGDRGADVWKQPPRPDRRAAGKPQNGTRKVLGSDSELGRARLWL